MIQSAAIPVSVDGEKNPKCRHYWVIQPAMGPVSQGVCKSCGETGQFENYIEGASWGETNGNNASKAQNSADQSRVYVNKVDDEDN